MRAVTIPGTQLSVSALAYGTAEWGKSQAPFEKLYAKFREAGGTCFDTAHCYAFWRDALGESERALGQCVRASDQRKEVILMSKGGHPSDPPRYPQPDHYLGPEPLAAQVQESLERLGTDYIDLYFLHRDDTRVPVGEVMDALAPHVKAGKLRYLGASHWSTQRIADANAYAAAHGIPGFCASQPGFNLGFPTPPARPYGLKDRNWHAQSKLSVFAFSPTAGGFFSGTSVKHFDNPQSQARLERTRKLGAELGATPGQIALAWLMFQPFTCVPILGTTKLDHLEDAVGATRLTLTSEQVRWLEGDEVPPETQQ